MNTISAPRNLRGFDCNFPLSDMQARAMVKHGYRFAVRYVPRIKQATHDLTASEVKRLLDAGLGIMPVQHVEQENWTPTPDKGRSYGQMAAESATNCGILTGTSVWLDLEGVDVKTDPEDVIKYCNYWYDQVQQAGFLPGIYVGWHAILKPDQLYRRLKFQRYWSAYNLDKDQFPAVVGVCMKQGPANRAKDYPPGWDPSKHEIDTDIVTGDAQSRFPMVMAPDEWDLTVC